MKNRKGAMALSLSKGFTLIELLVVMTVIAIIATLALFGINKAQAAARDVKREQIMTGLQATLNRYYGDNNSIYFSGANNFCGLITELFDKKYIAAKPVDPNGTTLCGSQTTGEVAITDTNIRYIYATGTGTYTLTLWKESGGNIPFASPE